MLSAAIICSCIWRDKMTEYKQSIHEWRFIKGLEKFDKESKIKQ